jgi:ribosomal protein S18 acetylase RimI-like enzyme
MPPQLDIMQNIQLIRNLYETAFPVDERRHFDDLVQLSKAENEMHIKIEYLGNEILGFIIYWDFANFVYVEHFAVSEKFRDNGYGSRMFRDFLKHTEKTLVLEIETPDNVLARKRLQFYQRMGMFSLPFHYIQPPYNTDTKPVNMLILSNKNIVAESEFEEIKTEIFEKVYFVKNYE